MKRTPYKPAKWFPRPDLGRQTWEGELLGVQMKVERNAGHPSDPSQPQTFTAMKGGLFMPEVYNTPRTAMSALELMIRAGGGFG